MNQPGKLKVDDTLLELIRGSRLPVSRYGLYVTIASIVFVLILCAVSLRVINSDTKKFEASAQTAVNQFMSRQYEKRTLALAHSLDAPSAKFYLDQNCDAFSVVFTLYPALREVVITRKDGTVRAACRGRLYSEIPLRTLGTTITDQKEAVSAISFAQASSHPVFSEPYTRGQLNTAYVDLIIPQILGENVIATVSLTRQLRDLAAQIDFETGYRLHILLDGKIFPAETDMPIPSGSSVIESQLSPLPYNVSFLTVNTAPSDFPFGSAPARTIISLAVGLLVALLLLLRYQLRQVRSASEMSARIAIQRTFNDSITDALLVVGLNSQVLYANAAFEKLFGWRIGSPVGRMVLEAAGMQVDAVHFGNFGARLYLEHEYKAHRLDGSTFDCHAIVTPLKPIEEGARSMGWLVTLRDVTEQNRARIALATEHQRTVLMIESMNAAVSVVHLEEAGDELLYANAAYTRICGDSVRCHMRMQKLFEEAQPVGHTAEIHDDETGRWLSVTRSVLPWPGKGLSEMLAVTDITERKEVEHRMQMQTKAAERASNLITMGEMASSLAHEINQPLAAVQNYAAAALTMIQKGRMDENRAAEALNKIVNQTQRAAYIIRRIRSFAKSKEGEANITATPVGKLVAAAMELALMQAKLMGMTIEVRVDNADHVLVCDAVMIEQVLINLLKNGMEASLETASRSVSLTVTTDEAQTVFEVADHGCGLSGTADKVFSPFFSTKATGMGIGLNICRSVVESHRGRMQFLPNEGGGTLVRVLLPNSGFAEPDTPASDIAAVKDRFGRSTT